MKLSLALSVLVGLAAAAEPGMRSFRKRSITVEPFSGKLTLRAAEIPADAPAGYSAAIHYINKRSLTDATNLQAVPADVKRRQDGAQALRRLRRLEASAANDFFECAAAVRLPPSPHADLI
jgi:hypothetical protein